MSAFYIMIIGLGLYYLGVRFYSKYLSEKIYRLDPNFVTPAHRFNDGSDFVPTNKHVLFGHHFSSVAGAAPILGPAIAVIWGWLPAFLWVVLGTIFAGAVHDFGTLWVSNRHNGYSIGTLSEKIINSRVKILFLLIILSLVVVVNAVFTMAIADLFIQKPESVLPINVEIPLAIGIGFLVYKKGFKLLIPSLIALIIMYLFIWIGNEHPFQITAVFHWLGLNLDEKSTIIASRVTWIIFLLIYSYIASSIPVWVLLQPRDYINSHKLFLGLGLLYGGVIILTFTKGLQLNVPYYNPEVSGAPFWFPVLFITIACGAISGFHGLVGSGTSSKQMDKETDARYIGYGGAIGEGSLALISIIACIAGLSAVQWGQYYNSWASIGKFSLVAFVEGAGNLASAWGISSKLAGTFVAVIVISFAATSLDTSVRILRYVITEIAGEYQIKFLQKGWLAALIGVVVSGIIALYDGEGRGGVPIWHLFGITNQMIAGLSLLIVGLYLKIAKRRSIYVLFPMVFILGMTSFAMVTNLIKYFSKSEVVLFVIGSIIFILELWLILEAIFAIKTINQKTDTSYSEAG